MMTTIKTCTIMTALALFVLVGSSVCADKKYTKEQIDELVREVDQLYRSETSYSELEMEIITPRWERTLAMFGWSEGTDKTFIRITSPKKEQGMATLRIDNEMWNFLPKTNKVIKIPPSMMMSSWMGSDFTNDDLVKEFSLFEDYTYELIDVEGGSDDNYYINCIPREDLPVVWKNVVIAARKSDRIPLWMKYYDEKNQLMRILNYSEVKKFGNRMIPSVMEMIPQNKEGNKTVIRYIDIQFDLKLDDDIFSLRNLQSEK